MAFIIYLSSLILNQLFPHLDLNSSLISSPAARGKGRRGQAWFGWKSLVLNHHGGGLNVMVVFSANSDDVGIRSYSYDWAGLFRITAAHLE